MSVVSRAAYADEFLAGYLECALWTSLDDDGEPLDGLYSADDLAEETRAAMKADCDAFVQSYWDDLRSGRYGYGPDHAGHDFWLTRNRHGAGFWDRGAGETGARLTEASHAFGESSLYVGDDGRIYAA